MTRAALHALALALALAAPALPAAAPAVAAQDALADGAKLLQEADRYRAPGDHFVFRLRVRDPEDRRVDLTVRVRDRTKGLVRYEGPAGLEGRAILYVGRDMWVYVPGTRRALRITPRQRVLGAVAGADVARTVFAEDYAVQEAEAVAGGKTRLDLRAKSRGTAYARVVLTVRSNDARPLAAEFYAADGERLLKTLTFEDYRQVLGRPRPMTTRVVDHIGGGVTVMRYSDMRIEETPGAWFNPARLNRL